MSRTSEVRRDDSGAYTCDAQIDCGQLFWVALGSRIWMGSCNPQRDRGRFVCVALGPRTWIGVESALSAEVPVPS
jgi:hypothetical protein